MPQAQGLTVVKSEPLQPTSLSVVKSEPLQAATPPPDPRTPWEQHGGWEGVKSRAWEQTQTAGGPVAQTLVRGAVDTVLHPVRNLPLIGGGVGAVLGGPFGAALGAAGGEAWRQNYETGKSLVTGRPAEQPQGPVANLAPPTTTAGGAALSIGREALTSGLLPEVAGRGVSRVLSGPLRPPPGSADAAVAATSKEFGLGLTPGEVRSSVGGRAVHGVEKVGNIGVTGHAITERGRAVGEARASDVLAGQLDAITPAVDRTQAGEAVNASAKDARARLLEQHQVVQRQREIAHGRQEAARRAVHTTNQQAALAEHRTAQAGFAATHDAAEAQKATAFRAANQATFDAAFQAKQAAGQRMGEVAQQVTTPVDNSAIQAKAQDIINRELRPPAEAYPLTKPEAPETAALSIHAKSGAPVPFESLPPDAQAYLREQAATTGEAVPAEIDPLQYAQASVRKHLTRIANAEPTTDFATAHQYYSDLLADSKFLKALKSPGEGQLTGLAQAHRGALEEAATASGVDWAATSADYASAADTAREAAKGLNKRYTPKPYKVAGFKYPAYTPEKFKADPFSVSGNLKRMLTEEPSQLLDAFSKNGRVVPERIRAARETLLKTVADQPVVPPQATRNAAAQAEQVASGVKPGTPGAAASYPTGAPAATKAATPPPGPHPPVEFGHTWDAGWGFSDGDQHVYRITDPAHPEFGSDHGANWFRERGIPLPPGTPGNPTPAAGAAGAAGSRPFGAAPDIPPRPTGPWDANAPPPPGGSPPPGAAAPAPPSAMQQRGQQAWDQLRTTLVRDQILTGPMHGLKARLDTFGEAGLQELFPGEPQVGENLQRIGEAFARRGAQPPTWQYRTLEALAAPVTAVGMLARGASPGAAAGTGAGVLAGLEGVPAVIAWAAHSPRMTKLLLEGVTNTDSSQVLTTFTRLMEAYRLDQRGKAATPPPGPGGR